MNYERAWMLESQPIRSSTVPHADDERGPAQALKASLPEGGVRSWRLGFWGLVVTQFQGAFNDNALKFLVIYILVDMNLPARERDSRVLVVGGLFALPFIFIFDDRRRARRAASASAR